MNLDYYAKYKIAEMQQEANHRRLVQHVRVTEAASNRLYSSVDLIGRQFIRLGTALTKMTQPNAAPVQQECVDCV